MMTCSKILLLASSILISGCATTERQQLGTVGHTASPTENTSSAFIKGREMLALKEYGLAIDSFRLVLRHDPRNAEAHNAIAISFDALGRPDLARRNFELALGFAPSKEKFYRNFARHLQSQGEERLADKLRQDFELAQGLSVITPPAAVSSGEDHISSILARVSTPAHSLEPLSEAERKLTAPPANPSKPDQDKIPAQRIAILTREPAIQQEHETVRQTGLGKSGDKGGLGGIDANDGSNQRILTSQQQLAELMENLDRTLAELYRGIGSPLFSDSGNGESKNADAKRVANELNNTQPQGFAALMGELEKLSEKESKTITATLDGAIGSPGDIGFDTPRNGPYLSRVSLGEVMLVTKPEQIQSPPTRRDLENLELAENKNPVLSGRLEFFVRLTAILESDHDPVMQAVTQNTGSTIAALDAAMADLKERRLKRSRSFERQPSNEMRAIAAWLYRIVEVENGLAFRASVKKDVLNHNSLQISKLTMQYRPKQQCLT